MNWVKENKFLTGYIIVMVIALGVLGYEVFSASGAYDDTQGAYEKQSAEYNRLRHLAPFPDRKNLEQYEQQKVDAAKVITAFQEDLAKKEFPLEQITEVKFQDLLKDAVTDVRKKAADAGVKLPDKFFLGFDKYETTPPTPEAAAPLGRELKAIQWIVNQYIEAGVADIANLSRADLPEERPRDQRRGGGPGGPGGSGSTRPGGSGDSRGRSGGSRDLVHYYYFDIDAILKQPKLQSLLNIISGPKAPQFYVVRQIQVKNQAEKGPSKATPGPDASGKEASINYLTGEEFIEATLRIDIVDFNPPTSETAAADKSAPPAK